MLNNTDRLKAIKNHNEICTAKSDVSAETENEISTENMSRYWEVVDTENKKEAVSAEEERLRIENISLLTENVVKYSNGTNNIQHADLVKDITSECNVMFLKEIFIHHYNLKKG